MLWYLTLSSSPSSTLQTTFIGWVWWIHGPRCLLKARLQTPKSSNINSTTVSPKSQLAAIPLMWNENEDSNSQSGSIVEKTGSRFTAGRRLLRTTESKVHFCTTGKQIWERQTRCGTDVGHLHGQHSRSSQLKLQMADIYIEMSLIMFL